MNFEQFHLPGFLLKDLYKESLVELNEIQKIPEKTSDINANILGNNQKQVLILVSYPGELVITDTDLTFLLTILNACNLSLNDVSILNKAAAKDSKYQELIELFKPAVILLFGVPQSAISMPVHFPDYQVQAFKDIRFLSAPTLNELQLDKTIKMKLWAGLKKIFLS
jgi:hypothetical protein